MIHVYLKNAAHALQVSTPKWLPWAGMKHTWHFIGCGVLLSEEELDVPGSVPLVFMQLKWSYANWSIFSDAVYAEKQEAVLSCACCQANRATRAPVDTKRSRKYRKVHSMRSENRYDLFAENDSLGCFNAKNAGKMRNNDRRLRQRRHWTRSREEVRVNSRVYWIKCSKRSIGRVLDERKTHGTSQGWKPQWISLSFCSWDSASRCWCSRASSICEHILGDLLSRYNKCADYQLTLPVIARLSPRTGRPTSFLEVQ